MQTASRQRARPPRRPVAGAPVQHHSLELGVLRLQRAIGNRAVVERLGPVRSAPGDSPPLQRVIAGKGADLLAATEALRMLPAPPEEKLGLFSGLKRKIGGLLGKRSKPSAAVRHREDTSWGAQQLEQARLRVLELRAGLSGESLGEVRSRASTGGQVNDVLRGLSRTLDVLEEGLGTLPREVAELRETIAAEGAAVRELLSGDPIGVRAEMSWSEAIDFVAGAEGLKAGITADSDINTLNRGNTARQRLAYDLVKSELAGRTGRIVATATDTTRGLSFADDALDGEPPYLAVRPAVDAVLHAVAPLVFDTEYVSGSVFDLLANVTQHAGELGKPVEWSDEVAARVVIDVLFLRAINGALADAFGGLQRTNVANEALNVVVSLVQAAANDTRGGQAGERYGRGQGMAEMRRLRNAFLSAILAELHVAHGQRVGV